MALLHEEGKATTPCSTCRSICRKFGKHRNGLLRYQCPQSRRTFTEAYNFCRVHMKLRVTPAMEARIAVKVWTLRELLEAA